MTGDLLRGLQRHLLRLKAERVSAHVSQDGPLSLLFERQRQVIDDEARFKALLCGGRAGKTSTCLIDFVDGMQQTPNSNNLYIGITRPSAKNILWEPLRALNVQKGWNLSLNETELRARQKNGSWLLCVGSDDKRELEKIRGIPWNKVKIDECGSMRPSYLEYLIEEVVEPRLMDRRGSLWLSGTPTRQAVGYFHDVTTGLKPGWSVHKWTARDNPHIDWDREIPELLKRRNWTEDNPKFRREYLAEWIVESEALVYRFLRQRNVIKTLPKAPRGYDYILSLDFGFGHATAWSVIAVPREYGNTIYVVESGKITGKAPSEVAPIIQGLVDKYKPYKIVGDVGGIGKAYAVEYTLRYGVPIEPANKADRRAGLEIVSDMLFTGRLLSLEENEGLHREWATLQWDEERKDVAGGQDDDESDAAMYGAKASAAFLQDAEAPRPIDLPTWALEPDEDEEDEPERSYLEI